MPLLALIFYGRTLMLKQPDACWYAIELANELRREID